MTDKSEMIRVRVTPDEKQEIQDYLNETGEFPSMSRMLRTLAKQHIRTDEDTASIDPDEIVDAVEIGLSDVTEYLQNMDDRLANVEQKVSDEDEIDKLARELYDEIPVVKSEEEMRNLDSHVRLGDADEAAIISTPDAWADFFDVDLPMIRRALARANDYYPDLHYYNIKEDGTRRYYVLDRTLTREGE